MPVRLEQGTLIVPIPGPVLPLVGTECVTVVDRETTGRQVGIKLTPGPVLDKEILVFLVGIISHDDAVITVNSLMDVRAVQGHFLVTPAHDVSKIGAHRRWRSTPAKMIS